MIATAGFASRTLTFVLAGGRGERLHPLTRDRAKPAVAFAGGCRLIDFTLSNCINSGLRQIHVLTQHCFESIHSHVRTLRLPGVSIRCVPPASGRVYAGTADAVLQNVWTLECSSADFVAILSADHVYRMDYRDLIRHHAQSGADLTIAAVECPTVSASQFGVLEADSAGCVVGFQEKPKEPRALPGKPAKCLTSMGVYVFNRRALIDSLWADARAKTSHDFGNDVIPALVERRGVFVYNFTQANTQLSAYWRDVGTLDGYFRANMELLSSGLLDAYENARWPIHTQHSRMEQLSDRAVDSVIPLGVSLGHDSRLTRSVVAPNVRVGPSSVVENSILLDNVKAGAGVRIERAIVAENVRIADGVQIGVDRSIDEKYGFVTEAGILVIPPNTEVRRARKALAASTKWTTAAAPTRRQIPYQTSKSPKF